MSDDDGYCLDTGARDWMNDPSNRKITNEHRFVEIFDAGSGIQIMVEQKRDDEIAALCATPLTPGTKWALRLLLSTQDDEEPKITPYSKAAVAGLRQHWRLPGLYANLFVYQTAFAPVPGVSSWKGLLSRIDFGSGWGSTVEIAHNTNTNVTYGVCFGLCSETGNLFLDRLMAARGYAIHPCLALLLVTDLMLTDVRDFEEKMTDDFEPLIMAIGTESYRWISPVVAPVKDFAEIPRRLATLADAGASMTCAISMLTITFEFLGRALEDFKGFGAGCRVEEGLKAHLSFTRSKVKRMEWNNQQLKESAQAQVQLVYALLAQKDNQISHRYGADMRIISAVTLIFLPGTFIATLFSASFWNFQPTNTGPIVSKWVWLYFVVTALLTLFVWSFWRGYPMLKGLWRRKKNVDEEQGEKKKKGV
ncbi:hypothetical protein K505DRAFT_322826 [Melanomma pulvis-pyrius CBS 109.77]|uniref:Uncharacterized protein n=1 Tax=Melanomma pulvis-pyrius CBS 109.77 TaxID=1314802 RepID=A0A6A6XNH9_9PLEO|nr:hypothetical protein K505DRAFT_322826 [Melanomma pulvis-pyrius CBS 109.77]